MKMILVFLGLMGIAGINQAQDIYPGRDHLVYDTFKRSPEEKEKIIAFERLMDSLEVLPVTAHPDTGAKYRLVFKGDCLARRPISANLDLSPGEFHCGLVPVSPGHEYSPWELALMGDVTVYGGRYALVRPVPVFWDGDATFFTQYIEYYLERIE